MASVRRGVTVAVAGALVAGAVQVLAYPHLPDVVMRHGSMRHPDAWSTRQGWLAFALPFTMLFPLATMGFVALVGQYREGFHVPSAQAQAYWTSDENWPRARALLVDAMGWFSGWMSVLLAAEFTLTAGGLRWGLPVWLCEVVPVAALLGLAAWLALHLARAYRLPG